MWIYEFFLHDDFRCDAFLDASLEYLFIFFCIDHPPVETFILQNEIIKVKCTSEVA